MDIIGIISRLGQIEKRQQCRLRYGKVICREKQMNRGRIDGYAMRQLDLGGKYPIPRMEQVPHMWASRAEKMSRGKMFTV